MEWQRSPFLDLLQELRVEEENTIRARQFAGETLEQVDLESLEEDSGGVNDASADGRNFAVSGGVARAVVNVIRQRCSDREVKVAAAEGLRECRKMIGEAVKGKYPGYLLEGMACPGGCVAGAGTMQPIRKAQAAVGLYARQANHEVSSETEHIKELDKLVD